MRLLTFTILWVISGFWLAACSSTSPGLKADTGPRTQTISVISNAWHTAIVLPGPKVVKTGLLPESADFPDAAFLEFGWGDRVYYPADEPTFEMALTAAMTSTPAVMHIAVRSQAPYSYEGLEVIDVALTKEGFTLLVKAIAGELKRPQGGRTEPVSTGLYPQSYFYEAKGSFHLFNTCNTWTARMLQTGGLELSPTGVSSANELMARLRRAVASH